MTNYNKIILIFLASLVVSLTACYTQRAVDTEYFRGTAKVTRFTVEHIQYSGLTDTAYSGKFKLRETDKEKGMVYYFKSTIKTYNKNRYYVIEFSDDNHNKIEPGLLFDIDKNSIKLGRYSTLVQMNSKTKDGKMTKKLILDLIITWLNRDRYK